MFVPEIGECFARDARKYLVVHGYRDADAVAFTRAEASHKRDFVFKFVFRYLFLEHFDDFGRAFYITGTPYANSYYHYLFPYMIKQHETIFQLAYDYFGLYYFSHK